MEERLSGAPPSAPFVLRTARDEDLDGIERLENTVFETDRLSRRNLRYSIRAPATEAVVASSQGQIAGYAMIGFRIGSKIGRVFSLAVEPTAARRGIGRAMLAACEERAVGRGCVTVRLEVRSDNRPAIRLYEASAYRVIGAYEDYYEDGTGAIRFEKSVGPAPGPGMEPETRTQG